MKDKWIVATTAIETITGTENSVEVGTILPNVLDEDVNAWKIHNGNKQTKSS